MIIIKTLMNVSLAVLDRADHVFECSNCFSKSVYRQDDGSYICSICHVVQDIQETYDEIDNLAGQETVAHSYRITHKEDKTIQQRVNRVVLAEALQLILAVQTVSIEKLFGISISDSVFYYYTKFYSLIEPPIKVSTFPKLLLVLLSGITHIGIPATHIDIIKWIRDGTIPYYKPTEFLPKSFLERISKAEANQLDPPLINLSLFMPNREQNSVKQRIHPLPNAKLFLWRVASQIGIPEKLFVTFCLSLATSKPLDTISNLGLMLNEDRSVLYSISKFMRIGVAMPIALSIFALSLVYRLDGTDWINPNFQKLGFPKFSEILKGPLIRCEIMPAFPKINGRIPHLHTDLIRLMENDDCARVELSTIVNDVNIGFSEECTLVSDISTIAEVNNDIKVLIAGLSRCFGVGQHLILQQFALLIKKRFGLFYQKRTVNNNNNERDDSIV